MEVEDTSEDVDHLLMPDSIPASSNSRISQDDLLIDELPCANYTTGNEKPINVQSRNDEFSTIACDIDHTSRVKVEKSANFSDIADTSSKQSTVLENKTELTQGTIENVNDRNVSQTPLAFTVDFGNNKEMDVTKYQNLFERYNARHKRNLSTSKVFIIFAIVSNYLSHSGNPYF